MNHSEHLINGDVWRRWSLVKKKENKWFIYQNVPGLLNLSIISKNFYSGKFMSNVSDRCIFCMDPLLLVMQLDMIVFISTLSWNGQLYIKLIQCRRTLLKWYIILKCLFWNAYLDEYSCHQSIIASKGTLWVLKRGIVIVYNRQLPRFVFIINKCIEKIHIQDTHVKKDFFSKDYLFVNC